MIFNYKMIQLARECRGLSQATLAAGIGIPQPQLSELERGKTLPDEKTIERISNNLNFPLKFFTFDTSINRLSKFYYRKRETLPTKHIAPLEAKMDIMRKSYSRLLSHVNINYRGLPNIRIKENHTPETAAQFARLFFNLDPDKPIDNPISIVEKVGIPVIQVDVDSDKFSGLTLQTDENHPVIILNKNLPNDHQKFTLFHELGHLIMHVPFSEEQEFYEELQSRVDDFESQNIRKRGTRDCKEIIEKQADEFASAFLMPAQHAKATFGCMSYQRLSELKLYWKVSKQSILYRAKTLDVVDERKFQNIYIELSRNGERKQERLTIPLDEPSLVKKIVSALIDQNVFSNRELAEHIGLSLDDMNSWFSITPKPLFSIIRNNN